jgi:phosphopantetheine--protein transferase-like protein
MNQLEVLRGIVAKLGETQPDSIGPDFSLQSPALKGSIKRAALAASIRRQLGINCPAAHSVGTFAELEQAVFRATTSPAPDASPPASRPIPVPVALSPDLGSQQLRCGVDIEMISELPEAVDYREHEFYRDTFSPEEIAYCVLQENPRMHFAGRWCVKEALYKCDPALRPEKMAEIEVVRTGQGEITLRHRRNGEARMLPHAVSLSHTNSLAVAVVVRAANEPPLKNASGNTPVEPGPPATGVVASPPGSTLPLISALAWLVAMGVSLFALFRSMR